MIPVRCFSCNKVLGHLERPWQHAQRAYATPKQALDALGLRRECCRRVMLTYVDMVQLTLDYERTNDVCAPNDSSRDYVTVYRREVPPLESDAPHAAPVAPAPPRKRPCIRAI